jgi:hypothetical protein
MKTFNLFVTSILLSLITMTSFAQMQNVNWRGAPTPALAIESVNSELAQINYMPNGYWYFTFVEVNSSALKVMRFDIKTQSWTEVFAQTFATVLDLDTYVANNKLYFGIHDDQTQFNFSLWEMDASESVTPLLSNAESSMANGGGMKFVVANDELFLSTKDSSNGYIVDRYNLTSQSYVNSTPPIATNISSPDIVVDQSDNSLVVGGIDQANNYYVYKSPIQNPLTFTPLNGNGDVTSTSFGGNATGTYFRLIEKKNNSPEGVFIFDSGSGDNLYRVGFYNNSAADMQFTTPDVLTPTSVAQFGQSTFVSGNNTISGSAEVWEVFPSGQKLAVADNTGSSFSTSVTEGIITSFSSAGTGRAAVFHHLLGQNGFGQGFFKMTNNLPAFVSSQQYPGCVGSYSNVIESLTFDDPDGDHVHIVPNTLNSTDQNVVASTSISAFESGINNWNIQVEGLAAGQTYITFSYTDGFDTLSASVTVSILDPETVSFTTTNIEICSNEDVVDMNDYVDSTGGTFFVSDYVTDDGMVPFDTLDILNYPYTEVVNYEYTDVNGCISTASSNLIILENPSSTLSVINSTCGSSDGEVVASINSPNGNFVNYWNTGAQGVTAITALSPGTYYHNIIDVKGCIGVSQANVQSSDVNVSGTITNASCYGANDGGIELSINGANGPYNVLWSSGHSTPTISNLTAGTYTAVVSNGNGCMVSRNFSVAQPTPIEMDYSMTAPDCGQSNGAVQQMLIQGGSGNYSYLWTSGGTGQDMTGVPAGNYGLQVTDAGGCTATRTFQLNPVEGAGVSADVTKAVCGFNSGSIELDVFPATGESVTSIDWSNGATTEDIYNLSPGAYTCQIQQSNGCTADYTWVVRPRKAPRPEICIVTVDTSTTSNLIVWEKPTVNLFGIHHYNIYRETNVAGQFQLIDTVNYSSISVFNDVVASPLSRSWRYKISAVTDCGTESIPSRAHKTIHLVMNDLGNGDYRIIWDNYEGFQYSTYNLLRHTEQDGWVPIITSIPLNALPDTTDTPPSIQGLDYMIEITPPGGLCSATAGKAQDYNASRSNKPRSEFNPGDGTGDPNNSLIKHENDNYTIAMYPNPSDGKFEVALYHEEANMNMSIQVVSIQGQVVYNSSIQNGVNYIDLGNVESGVYFVNIEDGNTSERLRIVIK